MTEILVAIISGISVLGVALIEHGRRLSKRNWQANRADHDFVVNKIETLGKSLGRSIDRVEETGIRTEGKLDQHINDHATGRLD